MDKEKKINLKRENREGYAKVEDRGKEGTL